MIILTIINLLTYIMFLLPSIYKAKYSKFIFSHEKKLSVESVRKYNVRKIFYGVIIFFETFIFLSALLLRYKYNISNSHNLVWEILIVLVINALLYILTRNYHQIPLSKSNNIYLKYYRSVSIPVLIVLLVLVFSLEYDYVVDHLRQIHEFRVSGLIQDILIILGKYLTWFVILGFILPSLMKLDILHKQYTEFEDKVKNASLNFLTKKTKSKKAVSVIDNVIFAIVWIIQNRIRRFITVILTLILLNIWNPYSLLSSVWTKWLFNLTYLPIIGLFLENMLELYFIPNFDYITKFTDFFRKTKSEVIFLRSYNESKKYITFKIDHIFIINDENFSVENTEKELKKEFDFVKNLIVKKKWKTYEFKIAIDALAREHEKEYND